MDELQVAIDDGIAVITINRPAQRNAVNYAMWCAIPGLCARLETDATVRVIIWQGAGDEAFSAGGDISEFREQRSNAAQTKAYNERVSTALDAVLALSKPTIALVKGFCVGGGFILAAYCDLRIAADNAQFGIPVAHLGMPITYSQMQRFVHLIGAGATLDLLLTARRMSAPEAREAQLCSQIFPLAEIDAAVHGLAQSMTRLSPLAQHTHKRMLQTILHKPDLGALTPEERAWVDDSFDSADYAEGVQAFL
ncbi:MAG: enoyl-CoA hydratase/isomerase family protein, partial [Caldilineaceae bacterium]|nr:enoyl-CoA hydratase/isomerase family protein [Caldilineaceae bacterium]